MKEIFLILAALTGAPQPAPEFRAPISAETAAAEINPHTETITIFKEV